MAYSSGQSAYSSAFELSPITLTNGIASNIPGGAMPLSSILQSSSYGGLLGAGGDVDISTAFGVFYPMPGSSLIENDIGKYPFANMAIAANCIISNPLTVSLLMRCPVRDPGGYATKLAILTALQSTLRSHCANGGTFVVATPSFFYTDVILLELKDISGGEGLQAQVTWQWTFTKPLVTLQGAQAAQNSMMQQLSNGTPSDGANTGLGVQNTATAATAGFIPASANAFSSGVPAAGPFSSTGYSGGQFFTGSWSPSAT